MTSLSIASRSASAPRHAPLVSPVAWRLMRQELGTLLGVVAALALAVLA